MLWHTIIEFAARPMLWACLEHPLWVICGCIIAATLAVVYVE